jgi:hypothetical protein
MKIGSYNNSFVGSNEIQKNNNKSDNKNKQEDMIQNSEKAQNSDKLEISSNVRNLNSIKEKIDSGFYDKFTVLAEVAKKITYQLDNEI